MALVASNQRVFAAKELPRPSKCPHIHIGDFGIEAIDSKIANQKGTDFEATATPKAVDWLGQTIMSACFSTIFRPNSDSPTTTTFNKIYPPAPTGRSNNVLELNLTTETFAFSKSIGAVPNRGLKHQNDITINGITYTQSVQDVTNAVTGKADGAATDIHIEPGLFLAVPATSRPELGASVVRLGSIPHGTTINATCFSSTATIVDGPPDMDPVPITPFRIGRPEEPIRFNSQDAFNSNAPRSPQDLSTFVAAGTTTQLILNDPIVVLRQAIKNLDIAKTITFEFQPKLPVLEELAG